MVLERAWGHMYQYLLEYDVVLKWPFIGDVTIELLNQTPEDNMTASAGDNDFPHFKFCHDSASNTHYIKDDTLYFRISVKISSQKQWLQCTV